MRKLMSEQTLTSPSLGPRTRRHIGSEAAQGSGQGGRDLFSLKQAQQLGQQMQHTLQLLLQVYCDSWAAPPSAAGALMQAQVHPPPPPTPSPLYTCSCVPPPPPPPPP